MGGIHSKKSNVFTINSFDGEDQVEIAKIIKKTKDKRAKLVVE